MALARGFTLIELLAVVAIVLILIAILFPVAGLVRERAQRVVCVANMRSIQTGFNMCVVDRSGALPSSDTTPGYGAPQSDWWVSSSNLTIGLVWPYVHDAKVYSCPAYPEPARTLMKRHFSVAVYIGGGARSWENDPTRALITLSRVRKPAATHVLVEEYDNRCVAIGPSPGAYDGFVVGLGGSLVDCPPFWHDMGANYSFLDGHAEYHKWVGPKIRTIDCYTWFEAQHGMYLPGTPLDDADFKYMRDGVLNAY